jgi:hypothetical protein
MTDRMTSSVKLEQGKQGVTGLMEDPETGVQQVYKLSRYMNGLPFHEYQIMKGLQELIPYCPHFCHVYSLEKRPIHPHFRDDSTDPFKSHERPLWLDVLCIEYIPRSIPYMSLIENLQAPFEVVMCVYKQVLQAISTAQCKKQFTHYDLHSMNILLRSCDANQVHVYCHDDDNAFCVPTYGIEPVLIDYGFSSSIDLNGHPLYCSLAYTNAGYMAPSYDPLADPKLSMVSLAEDFRDCRGEDPDAQRFCTLVDNLFGSLDLQNMRHRSLTNYLNKFVIQKNDLLYLHDILIIVWIFYKDYVKPL